MFPNLLGLKEYFHLTDKEMGNIIGVSRDTYHRKLRSGNFFPDKCQAFCLYFQKPFGYLFATDEEICHHLRKSFQTFSSASLPLPGQAPRPGMIQVNRQNLQTQLHSK